MKQKLIVRELQRFPTKNGLYLATPLGREASFDIHPWMFYIQEGAYTFLKDEKQVVRMDSEIMRIKDFKERLKHWVDGCPELYWAYHEIK